jgi:chromatin segregation and condensation protein Rec8/ScpA/Scc1 (kleisin family)
VIGASTDSQNQNPDSDLAWSAPFGLVHSTRKKKDEPDFVADLLEYLEYLPPEDFQIEKVLARIDRVLWKQADLPRAGRAFYESARLLKLKWQFLESPPSSVSDIFEIFRDLSRQTTDYEPLKRLGAREDWQALPRLDWDGEEVEGVAIIDEDHSAIDSEPEKQVTLREIQAQAHEETVERDAQLLGAFVESNGACDLSEAARELFHGNLSQALIAAIFASAKIQMKQEQFYGSVILQKEGVDRIDPVGNTFLLNSSTHQSIGNNYSQ